MKPKWKKIYQDTYRLQDKGPAGDVAIFLLVGSKKALLIDSGYGLLDLPRLIREITPKPVMLVNTHGHLDHANGSWQFEEAYLRSEDMEIYQKHAAPDFLQESFAKLAVHEEVKNRLVAMTAASPAKVKLLDKMTELDLGNRKVRILHMPGHTKGSVCVLDEENKSAFTGDNLNRSIWLSLPESVSVAEFKGVLKSMLPILKEKDIIWNYAAHWPGKTRLQDDIRRFILCCDAILSGSKKPRFLDTGVTSGNFVGKAGRYILYPREDELRTMKQNSIKPGKVWLDTNGKPIQAHGFSVFYNEKEGLWYWYGENKEKTDGKGTVWHWGVRLYTSRDLYNWEDKGLIIPPQPDDLQSPLHPTYCMDRPHIIYCEKTGKYVAWLKIMAGEVSQFFSIMMADKFEGPYEFVHKVYKPLEMDSGDFCLHVDKGTKKAYIWFERPHFQLICATLSDDYTEVTEEYSVHYDGLLPPLTREAPTFFERNGKKYLFTSGTSGYFPNQSRVCMFDDYHGEYIDLGDPCIGDKSDTTFNSQITSVIRIPGTDRYIACADRWNPQWWVKFMAKQIISGMERHFKDYKPDMEPKKPHPLPGEELKHGENTSIARYVWLPIEWEGDKPVIRWHEEWRI